MRVAVYYNNHDVRLEERPVPQTGPGEVLVKVIASGICGSDVLEWYRIERARWVTASSSRTTCPAIPAAIA
jgi:L-iditol 2-dehydrogenase